MSSSSSLRQAVWVERWEIALDFHNHSPLHILMWPWHCEAECHRGLTGGGARCEWRTRAATSASLSCSDAQIRLKPSARIPLRLSFWQPSPHPHQRVEHELLPWQPYPNLEGGREGGSVCCKRVCALSELQCSKRRMHYILKKKCVVYQQFLFLFEIAGTHFET